MNRYKILAKNLLTTVKTWQHNSEVETVTITKEQWNRAQILEKEAALLVHYAKFLPKKYTALTKGFSSALISLEILLGVYAPKSMRELVDEIVVDSIWIDQYSDINWKVKDIKAGSDPLEILVVNSKQP